MLALGDLNGDGQVNTFDIDLFVDVMGGNLMSARRYQYDEENRLTAVAEIDGNPLLEIEYDALGRRIATIDYEAPGGPQQMRHVYSGLNTVAEYVWSGSQWTLAREVLWGERFPEPLALFDFTAAGDEQAGTEEVLHYVHDALGSVVGLVDAGDPDATPEPVPPKLVERYDYDPYGKTYIESWDASAGGGSGAWVRTTASAYGNPFAWTGQRYDAGVGMYHFPFRSFSPELGRWMQRDPLGYINGPNAYAYARSMAVSVTDPLGLFVWIPPWIWGPLGPFGGDDDPMGPPLPPAPDPCGGGPAIADPEGAFGGPGGGDSGGGDSDGEQGGGGGGTNDTQPLPPPPPPPVFPPPQPPTPPVNPRAGGGSSGGGKGEGSTVPKGASSGEKAEAIKQAVKDAGIKPGGVSPEEALANVDNMWAMVQQLTPGEPIASQLDLFRVALNEIAKDTNTHYSGAGDVAWVMMDYGEGLDHLQHFVTAAAAADGDGIVGACVFVGGVVKEVGDLLKHAFSDTEWDSWSDIGANGRGLYWAEQLHQNPARWLPPSQFLRKP